MADEGPVTIRPRRDSTAVAVAVAVVLTAVFAYITVTPAGPNSLSHAPAASGLVALVLLVAAGYGAWRLLNPDRWSVVIDGEGVHDHAHARTLAWPEIYWVGWSTGRRELSFAERPETGGYGIQIDVANGDCDVAEVLAAIERFSSAAGRLLELHEPRAQ
jgi:hypothetical protein